MKKLLAAGCLSLLISCGAEPTKVVTPSTQEPVVDLRTALSDLSQTNQVLGLVAGLSVNGEEDQFFSFGVSDLETRSDVSSDTPFRIASVTKPFTAVLILNLIDDGQFALNTTIERWFPDLPRAGDITVRHLLNHTSGLPMFGERNDLVNMSEDEIFLFEPGTQHAYSNAGYYLLGYIIEQESGQSYQDQLDMIITGPLGLIDTFYERKDGDPSLWAKGYSPSDESPSGFAPTIDIGSPFAAGGMRSSVQDMLRFSDALYVGELLSAGSLKNMTTAATVSDGRKVGDARYAPPEWGDPPRPPEGWTDNHYGLGLNLSTMYGANVYWHSGGIPGFNAIWAYIPEKGATLILLSNTDNGAVPAFEPLMKEIIGSTAP